MKARVMMVTYNHERVLTRAVDSVLMEEGSSSLSWSEARIDRLAGLETCLKVLQRRHSAPKKPTRSDRNICPKRNYIRTLRACQGEYVAMLDGDDYWTAPDKLSRQVKFLERHPACSICLRNALVVYEDGSRPAHVKVRIDQHEISTLSDLVAHAFLGYANEDFGTVRYCWWKAACMDSLWLTNRGVLSIGRRPYGGLPRRGRRRERPEKQQTPAGPSGGQAPG